ncbi:conserved hypothetical protein [Burkholderia cenocepacia]|uniref:DUF6262 family protein n=1 Tax=Burkholderia cenocepacia TaxID=95486 RepID=UPI00192C5826|nr:DUF6262 family protein [Burkholderia cenocepacia]CAD9227958.1 conserved hypothetical protein [Burkholderia cenocepacia]
MAKQYNRNEDIEQARVAINTLLENNQKVSVNAISELTGIKAQTLYTYPIVKQYLQKRKKYKTKTLPVAHKPVSKDDIEQTVEGYIQYIKDCYFTHAESINEVMTDMMTSVHDFSSSMFHQAVNKLQALDQLKASPILHGKFIGFFTKEEAKPVAAVEVKDDELDQILRLADEDNPFNDLPPQEAPKPAPKVKEKPKAQSYEQYFQMPLSNDKYFKMSFPSDIDDEDKQDIADYLNIVLKRKLKI